MTLLARVPRRILAATVVAAVALTSAHQQAEAQGHPVGGIGTTYYLNDEFTGRANVELRYGEFSDIIYFGDWDGNGTDTPMVRRVNEFHVRNTNSSGHADYTFSYGDRGDTVLVGDWDGDGEDTLAVRRGNIFYIKNSTTTGVADQFIVYGDIGDAVLVGDWDGDGKDTLTVRRGNRFYVKNSIASGVADTVFSYGDPSDVALVGDWDGDGKDTLAVRRGNVYYLSNRLGTGTADKVLAYGNPSDTAFTGDWDGDGDDTLGVRRAPNPPLSGFGPGLQYVHRTVQPGIYRSTEGLSGCAWSRMSGLGGTDAEYLGWGSSTATAIAMIEPGDTYFRSDRCGSWVPVEQTYPATPASSIGEDGGTFVVNRHIAPGIYTAPGGYACVWRRLAGFGGNWRPDIDTIAYSVGMVNPVVAISPEDAGFLTQSCGPWKRVA